METAKLKKFARFARDRLIEQVSAKLEMILAENSTERRERVGAVKRLEETIKRHDKEQVIERAAYIWFNRFCALRFMDVNRYTRIGVVSPAEGQFQPEILAEAKMGHIDEEMVRDKVRQKIFALLDGRAPGRDPQGEAYRLLVVAACNFWHKAMQHIDDYTELLMPDDLLSGSSILAYTREAMTPDACKDVEVIGWLYQFYISGKKDEVFNGLKQNRKITPENIPAATQLFTPHWIVRYLVENSLGRLWMLNRPGSKLVEQMDYYIRPEQPETDFLKISGPEEIKVCDPACGSGHMLTYAFDLLHAIYEEEGYDPSVIPEKILANNLYGIEIDERAGELAAFALTMKARSKQRRFFNKGIKPNICTLENIRFNEDELQDYMDFVGRDLFTRPLWTTLRQFEEANNFGSLIRPDVTDVDGMLRILEPKNVSEHLLLGQTHQKVLKVLRQSDYLAPKYHVVVANPPYMGGKGMNGRLGKWAKDNYPNSKSDLFATFIERNLNLVHQYGYSAMVTMQSWMFLSSYEYLREKLLTETSIVSMVHMANMVMGIAFGTSATVWKKSGSSEVEGKYCYVEFADLGAENKPREFPPRNERNSHVSSQGWFYRATAADFKKIPGSPIAYWVSDNLRLVFARANPLGKIASPRQGLATADNDRFTRFWSEVPFKNIGIGLANRGDAKESLLRWFPYNKGGEYRKWYGNQTHLVDWEDDGKRIRNFVDNNGKLRSRPQNSDTYFRSSLSWSKVTSAGFSLRYFPNGFIYDVAGCSIFVEDDPPLQKGLIALINSQIMNASITRLSPTINREVGQVSAFPVIENAIRGHPRVIQCSSSLIELGKSDWNSYETSWDFTTLPLLNPDYRQRTLDATYQKLRVHWREMTQEMQRLEEENNRIFIDAYGLQDELTPDVPLREITLTCNPYYRYGGERSEEELEALLLADTLRELVSWAVGCMFGRYALDKPGLILANQGEGMDDFRRKVFDLDDSGGGQGFEITFLPDADNVIPVLDGDWFTDDITERFKRFLRVAFGEECYEENLQFVEKALNVKGRRNYSIRDYFLGEFYNDHVKRYKKRPIYWMFSSPKGSFNALIYMHRYRPDTVSVVLNDYLREFRAKLVSHKNHLEAASISASASQSEKTKALKEIEKITGMITEMEEYEREILYPLATRQLKIDLDDGVKVNYPKFGAALKKIAGLRSETL